MFKRAIPFQEFWERGSKDLREIMFNLHDMSIENWMKLYSAFYDYMCSNGSDMKELYTQVSGLFSERCDQTFDTICSIESSESEKIIETYLEHRREYNDRKRVIDHILNYLNNSWVYKSVNTGVPDVYKIRVKADVIWREAMFSHGAQKKMTLAVLSAIVDDREGKSINDSAIKNYINDFYKLGFNPDIESEISPNVYTEHFETQLLEMTQTFYTLKSQEFYSECNGDFTRYMSRTQALIDAEEARVKRYLLEQTLPKVKALLNQTFIVPHKSDFYETFSKLLHLSNGEADESSIGLAYTLLNRVSESDPAIIEPLFKILEQHVENEGCKRIDYALDDITKSSDVFIRTVLQFNSTVMDRIVARQLGGNPQLKESAEIGFKKFVNFNSFTSNKDVSPQGRSLSQGAIRAFPKKERAAIGTAAPQALAMFCDAAVRRLASDSGGDHQGNDISDAIVVLNYINDKDVFGMMCEKLLSKRLIGGSGGCNLEVESLFVERLKGVQGQDFVKKMEVMINDINTNAETNEKFYEYCKERDFSFNFSFSQLTLSSGSWPIHTTETSFQLPSEVDRVLRCFETFYTSRDTVNKKLIHMHNLSKAELELHKEKAKYRIGATAFQLAILLLFRDPQRSELTLGDIVTALRVDPSTLKLHLIGILKTKMIRCEDPSAASAGNSATKFVFNAKFASKKPKFSLPVAHSGEDYPGAASASSPSPSSTSSLPLARTTPALSAATVTAVGSSGSTGSAPNGINGHEESELGGARDMEEIGKDRALKIQAAIVRVLKARKSMGGNELQSAVRDQLSKWFIMPPGLYKQSVEILIDKEFIKRTDDNKGFVYLA